MNIAVTDLIVFFVFILLVVMLSVWKGRSRQKDLSGEGYFLAGRNLSWWIIGVSLIAANISTEQFVGMSGAAAGSTGLAVAAYEWISAITLVVVAFFFLPRFVKSRISTIPEFMQQKYGAGAHLTVAFFMMMALVLVSNAAVLYSGALFFEQTFDVDLSYAVWFIALIAAAYTVYGGLSSVAWADVIQGSSLVVGGIIVCVLGIYKIGGWDEFLSKGSEKMHMILPSSHQTLPWTALIGGLWIPAFYYWGLNQYIVQKALAARNIEEGQKGVLMAALLKLITPLAIVFPGIIAYILYKDYLAANPDAAYPYLIRELVPVGLKGFIYAAIAGAVISSLAAMLNSASTIFTLDIYRRFVNGASSDKKLVYVGRLSAIAFVVIAAIIAPQLGNPNLGGIFTFIQEFQGYFSPGILAAFLFGIFVKRPKPKTGVIGLWAGVVIYGILHYYFNGASFLNRMAYTFFGVVLIMLLVNAIAKQAAQQSDYTLSEEIAQEHKNAMPRPARLSQGLRATGVIIVLLTILLFIIFK